RRGSWSPTRDGVPRRGRLTETCTSEVRSQKSGPLVLQTSDYRLAAAHCPHGILRGSCGSRSTCGGPSAAGTRRAPALRKAVGAVSDPGCARAKRSKQRKATGCRPVLRTAPAFFLEQP